MAEAETRGSVALGFTAYELLYLLSLNRSDSARKSAEILGFGEVPEVDETTAVGASSLLARELLIMREDETLQPVRQAALIGAVLTKATQWLRGGILAQGNTESALFVEAPDAKAMVQPRALGTWWITPLMPQTPLPAIMRVFVETILKEDGDCAVTLRRLDLDGLDQTLSARLADDKDWEIATGRTGQPDPEQTIRDLAAQDFLAEVERWVA